ncbi:TetR/AcrR family transcriptional regulator [Actinoplanes sp. NPDC023714]|uniref:TetR/AcrR family transcriptional regulator n=1 Tax=Actinoplanes sp. NPDC023714 TaxID=3154322 RepID=UPI0033E5B346
MSREKRPGGRTARNRSLVLDAVAAILLEQGFDALTVDAVAERSGVHRTTVYRRWRDVGGLLADSFDAAREDAWEPPDTGSLVDDLIAINRQVVAAFAEQPSVTQALIAASFRSAAAERALREFWEDRFARCGIVVTRAAERGEIRAGADARAVIVAACAPVFYELALMRGPAGADIAERYARMAASGL